MEGAPGERREALKQGRVRVTLVFRETSSCASAATAKRRVLEHEAEQRSTTKGVRSRVVSRRCPSRKARVVHGL
jgi:hypothetical protein